MSNREDENSYLNSTLLDLHESQRDLPLLIAILDQLAKTHQIFTADFDIASSHFHHLSKSDINLLLKIIIELELENSRLRRFRKIRYRQKSRFKKWFCSCLK